MDYKKKTIEEKAKRYDDLLVKLQEAKVDNNVCDDRYCCVIDDIVPELKESECEKWIPKEIAKYLKEKGGYRSCWIAWLEKHIGLAFHFHQLEEYIMQLEKQSEQKSLDDIAKEVTKDKDAAVSFFKSAGIINENGELADEYKIEQGEQKPTDETKFKIEEGKWYVCISQFCNCIEGRAYKATSDNRVMDDFGTEYDMHSNAYKYFRLWTIQDAKNGDVLVSSYNQPFLFKEVVCDEFGKVCCAYGGIDGNKKFIANTHEKKFWTESEGVEIATKEQRELLFQKMHEAGYEWDSEKKELKKNEPMPTAEGMKIISRTKCEFAEWSEEDEKTLNECVLIIKSWMDSQSDYYFEGRFDYATWLESLKDRVQPKQEWSEEDEYKYNTILHHLDLRKEKYKKECNQEEQDRYRGLYDWFKSLKPQNTWKPSDEQMKILNEVLNFAANHESSHWNDYIFGTLNNLIRQLKKLKS